MSDGTIHIHTHTHTHTHDDNTHYALYAYNTHTPGWGLCVSQMRTTIALNNTQLHITAADKNTNAQALHLPRPVTADTTHTQRTHRRGDPRLGHTHTHTDEASFITLMNYKNAPFNKICIISLLILVLI